MGDIFVFASGKDVSPDKRNKDVLKSDSKGSAARKGLKDITNLLQKPRPSDSDLQSHLMTSANAEQLRKENMALTKQVTDQNKIIELSGIEIQKLRANLQKARQQNYQLARANSQMLAELNAGKDRLRVLQHELGCKNGLLTVKSLELQQTKKTGALPQIYDELEEPSNGETGVSPQADNGHNKPHSTNVRRQSKANTAKGTVAEEKLENRRRSMRRQSSRFTTLEQESKEDFFEIDGIKYEDKKQEDDCSIPSASSIHTDNKETRNINANIAEEGGSSSVSNDNDNQLCSTNGKRRSRAGRPSIGEGGATKEMMPDSKRNCSRKRSSVCKSKPEPTEDLFEISEARFPMHTETVVKDPENHLEASVNTEPTERTIIDRSTSVEGRRSSVGRPMRRAAEKVNSYKEVPLNVKMRRSE